MTRQGWARRRRVVAIGVVVLAADIVTKTWAAQVLTHDPVRLWSGRIVLTESRNPGAAFGLGTSLTPVLTVLAAAAVVAAVVMAARAHGLLLMMVFGLALGGAAGNLTDRLFRSPGFGFGHVVDWISIGWWPTFNLADGALVTAAALAVLQTVTSSPAHTEATRGSTSPVDRP